MESKVQIGFGAKVLRDNYTLPDGCPTEGNVILGKDNLLIFASNGNVYIKGRLVTNDIEIVEGMRTFLQSAIRR